MELEFLGAASILFKTKNNIKILCDPWFESPAFLGSWLPFPKPHFDYSRKIDFIYISHIHSDHLDLKTLSKLDKNITIVIYKFKSTFLFNKIKSLGFKNVLQLNNGEEFRVDKDTIIKIYGPTELHPSLAKQDVIDTSLLIKDDQHTVLNFNDNIYELRSDVLQQIKKENPKISLLCHGYTSASSYPQCTVSLDKDSMGREKQRVNDLCMHRSEKLIEFINPEIFMPFAGFYMLCGSLSYLNAHKANLHPFEALKYYQTKMPHLLHNRKCLVLNNGETFSLKTKKESKSYVHFTKEEVSKFIERNRKIKFPYEDLPSVHGAYEFYKLADDCYKRLENHRKKFNFSTDTKVILKLPEEFYLSISLNGSGYKLVKKDNRIFEQNFVMMEIDFRLLKMLMKGPRYAHWDNADHGSHIKYYKRPNVYEKGIYHLMCYFHQ